MKLLYFPAKTFTIPGSRTAASGNLFLSLIILMALGMVTSLKAQQITIYPRSNMVLNGKVFLVVNNAGFQNNGAFVADSSTVSFSGYPDTVTANISGANSTTFYNLSISKQAYGLALKSPVFVRNVLALNAGNLYTDSNLTLRSDKYLTARVDVVPAGSAIIGKANVERYFPAKRSWRLLTAPVTSSNTIFNSWQNRGIYTPGLGLLVTGPKPTPASPATAGNGLDPSDRNTSSMKTFNYSTQQFASVLNTNVPISQSNKGSGDNTAYFIFVRGDRNPGNTTLGNVNLTTTTSIGALQTGNQSFTASSDTGKYTLIGNPYASPVDFNNVRRNNLVKRFYAWDPTLNTVGGYVMLDDLKNTGSYTKTVQGSSQTKDIQSGQAFFVQTLSTGAAGISFTENSKSSYNNNMMFRPVTPGTPVATAAGKLSATLNLLNEDSSTTLADGAIAEFDNAFSIGIDLDDAAKFSNINENLCIQRNNVLLTAERRPAPGNNDTVFFKLTTTTQRNYQFVFNLGGLYQPGMTGLLEDSYLGSATILSLSGATTVNFSINADAASAAKDRFRVVFKLAATVLPVTISSVAASQKNSGIAVEWKVENEINMLKYDVEKSTDGAVFTRVNTTMVSGNNNTYNTYSWLDVNPVKGNNFYRIKSYDRSGAVKYSIIVKVAIDGPTAAGGFSIYPNPVTGNMINLVMNNQPAGTYKVRLSDATGQVIFVKNIQAAGGNSTQSFNTGSKLAAGFYQLEITGRDNNLNTQKVVVE